ncbi:MAG: HEAT repeat domain-containing protein [Candidatus Brocadiia bacterium]
MARLRIIIGILVVICVIFWATEQYNTTDGCCPRSTGGGGSSGGGSPAPVTASRPPLGVGIMPLIQTLKSGSASLVGVADPWEAWWTRNRELYLNLHQAVEWVKITEGATRSIKKFDVYEKLISTLVKGIQDKDQYVAFRSAVSLGMARDEVAYAALKKAYAEEKRFFVKNNIAFALGLTGDSSCGDVAKEMLTGKKESVLSRCYATASLGYVDSPGMLKFLQELATKKEDAEITCCAALSLGIMGDPSSIPILANLLNPKGQEGRKDVRIKAHAALALARIAVAAKAVDKSKEVVTGEKSSAEPKKSFEDDRKIIIAELVKASTDKERDARVAVAIALGMIKAEESKDTLFNLLKDSSGLVRGLAAISIAQMKISDSYDVILKSLQKSGEEDKGLMIIALGLMGDERIKSKFRDIIQSRKEKVLTKSAAAIALGMLKDKEAVPTLLDTFKKQDDPSYSPYVILALGMIGDESAVEPLKKKWEEVDPKNINMAAYTNLAVALTMLGKKDDIVIPRILKHCAKETNESIRVYAFHTLGIIGTRETAQIFVDAFNEESTSTETRKSIATGIGFLLDKNNAPAINRLTANNHFDINMIIMDHILPIPVW